MVGGVCIPVTLDTGADLTLLPVKFDCVKRYTGESSIVRGVGNTPQLAPVAEVEFHVEGVKMEALAAMVPGDYIKWEGALAFSLEDDKHWEWLSKINKLRKKVHALKDRRYIPVHVDGDGKIQGAVLVSDLPEGDERLDDLAKLSEVSNNTQTTPMLEATFSDKPDRDTQQSDTDNVMADGAEVDGGSVMVMGESSQLEKVEGEMGDGAGDKDARSTDVSPGASSNASRENVVKMTLEDDTLTVARNLADKEQNGYKWDDGLLFKFQLDHLGNSSKKLCVPKLLKINCLRMAHERFGHSGKNKVGKDLARFFY